MSLPRAIALPAVASALLCGVLVQPRAVSAHAAFVASTPAPDSVLAAAPAQITITFSETIARSSTLVVTGPAGAVVSGSPSVSGRQMTASLQSAGAGAYHVHWSNTSLDDGHDSAGSFQFTVAAQATPRAVATAAAPRVASPATAQQAAAAPVRMPPTGAGLAADTPVTAAAPLTAPLLIGTSLVAMCLRRRHMRRC
jgi:methionine-rich copper-binding protein CopC